MAWKFPLSDIHMGVEEIQAVTRVLESGWLTLGEVTHNFEQQFIESTGSRYAFAVTNATAALHMACLVANLGPGDEVIVPSLTFVATANAVRYVGANPVFADISGQEIFNISPQSIRQKITPKTRAIIVMHYAGFSCDMPEIMQIASEHGLVVIEDAAHAAGSSLDGKALGAWGQTGCFSFFSNKNMTTAEGGMIITQDEGIAERLRVLRSHGMTSMTLDRHKGHAWSYDVTELGFNYRIDEIRASLGIVQLSRLTKNNLRRSQITDLYRRTLTRLVPEIGLPFLDAQGQSAYHIFPILLPGNISRLKFMEAMKANGVQTSIHYPPIHTFSAYRDDYPDIELPVTEDIARREVTLPLYPGLRDDEVLEIVESVAHAFSVSDVGGV